MSIQTTNHHVRATMVYATEADILALAPNTHTKGEIIRADDTGRYFVGNDDGSMSLLQNSPPSALVDQKRFITESRTTHAINNGAEVPINSSIYSIRSNTLNATASGNGVVIPEAGLYRVEVYGEGGSGSTSDGAHLRVNGTVIIEPQANSDTYNNRRTWGGYFVQLLNAGDVITVTRRVNPNTSGITFLNLKIALLDVTVVNGVVLLQNFTPAAETPTGETFDGKPVYRQFFSGTCPNGQTTLLPAGTLAPYGIVDVRGHIAGYFAGWGSDGISSGNIRTGSGGALNLSCSGAIVGQPYKFSIDYIKP